MEEDGLDVVQALPGCVGIFHASDAEAALKLLELDVVEDLVEKSEPAEAVTLAVLVEGGDAAAFLSPVLEIVKTVIEQGRSVLDAIYCKNSHLKTPP